MKQFTAIAWKEWRENSPLLWIALGVFLGLPIIGGLEYMLSGHSHHFEITTEPGVGALGGIFTIFVAVGTACRDLNGRVQDFWRSRPVTAVRWMLVKFVIGLVIVLVSLLIPLLVGWMLDRVNDEARGMMQSLPAVWCLFYGVGFLAGCLLQRPAHAAVLALSALLLIYFMPIFLFPANHYRLTQMLFGDRGSLEMITEFFILAGGLFMLAMIASHLQWRIEPGPKFMYGTIAIAFLIFFFSTGYRLGTNLPVLQQVDLMPREVVQSLYMDGDHGYVISGQYPQGAYHAFAQPTYFRQIDLTLHGLQVGPPLPLWEHREKGKSGTVDYWLWSNVGNLLRRGDIEYRYQFNESLRMVLDVVSFKNHPRGELVKSIPLPITAVSADKEPTPLLYAWSNRLYLIGQRLITLDISDPLSPRAISSEYLGYPEFSDGVAGWSNQEILDYVLPPVPGLPDMERLKAAMNVRDFWDRKVFDGQILCDASGGDIVAFRLIELTPRRATFQRLGKSEQMMSVWHWGRYNDMKIQGDLLYAPLSESDWNPVVDIFSLTGSAQPRLIGHFAAQSDWMFVRPLPDGRAIVFGSKIWLVGPPPQR